MHASGSAGASWRVACWRDRLAIKVPTRMQDRLLNDRSVPYKWIYEYLPEGVVMEIYYKAADAEAKENAPDSLKGF